MEYIVHFLHASPSNVLFFGRSLGGGVATVLRQRYPGPIVSDRSFRSMTAAAQSVLAMLTKELLKKSLVIPHVIIQGVTASFLPFDLDVTDAWLSLSGPKLILFHLEDKMIDYDTASLHKVASVCVCVSVCACVCLRERACFCARSLSQAVTEGRAKDKSGEDMRLDGPNINDAHNAPISVCASHASDYVMTSSHCTEIPPVFPFRCQLPVHAALSLSRVHECKLIAFYQAHSQAKTII
jgi:hypothetical protein